MSWQAIARKDVRDARRSYWLWGLAAFFVFLLSLFPVLVVVDFVQIQGGPVTTDTFHALTVDMLGFIVPIIAIVLAYETVSGERDSGTIKLLMALPHSRLDVVVGKTVGRWVVVLLPVLAGFLVSAVVFLATPISLNADTYALYALLTGLLGITYAGIAVGISAGAGSSRRAMLGSVGVYVVFTLLWSQSVRGLLQLLTRNTGLEAGSATATKLQLFLMILNPTEAYKTLVSLLTLPPEGTYPVASSQGITLVNMTRTAAARAQIVGNQNVDFLAQSVPFYLSDPFVLLVIGLWMLGAPAIGYLAFDDVDL